MTTFFTRLAIAASFSAAMTIPVHAVTIDWVTVGDAGNAPDGTGYGAVGYSFWIMKYEWTNSHYVEFLNAVDPEGTNPDQIYSNSMGSDPRGGIIVAGTNNGSRYSAKPNMGDKPVNYVSWWDAARVANWLQAGAGTYATSSSGSAAINGGAYSLNGLTGGIAPSKNPGAEYWVPNENEWYKAAFYKGGGLNSGYWTYATQSDAAPTAVGATPVGTGSAAGVSPVVTGNTANFNQGASWDDQNGNFTAVGTNGGPSAYGAFDMSGNATEVNELDGASSSLRGFRGGNWSSPGAFYLSSSDSGRFVDPSPGYFPMLDGFRLVAVPEPSTYAMAVAGLACGGYSLFRRRRVR